MATSTSAQPEPQGTDSTENAPQVVVRAGKTFVCTACGTLVEIPADVVDQFEIPASTTSNKPQEKPQAKSPPPSDPPKTSSPKTSSPMPASSNKPASTRPPLTPQTPHQRSGRPIRQRVRLAGKIIDGLRVPSASQLDRAFSWVTYQLKVVDRQDSEIKRLKKLLKANAKFASSCPRPRDHENSNEDTNSAGSESRAKPTHAHALVRVSDN